MIEKNYKKKKKIKDNKNTNNVFFSMSIPIFF